MMRNPQSIQLYAKITDILPTEPNILPPLFPDQQSAPGQEILLYHGMNCVETFKDDIEKNGMTYAITVNRRGVIIDGNCRYWCAVALGWKYIPVNFPFFAGKTKKVLPKQRVLPDKDRTEDIERVLEGFDKIHKRNKEKWQLGQR